MPAERRFYRCRPRTVKVLQKKLAEIRKWIGNPGPPAEFHEEWFAGMCGEPGQFTEQLIKLREVLQTAGESESVRVR